MSEGAVSTEAIAAADAQLVQQAEERSFIEYKADLIYGPTDSGKTFQVGLATKYILQVHKMLSRLATADGGGAVPGLQGTGILETWAIGAWKDPIAAMHKAVRGYWPARLDDPESPLLAPDAGTWEIYGLVAFEGLTSFGDTIMRSLKDDRASLSQDPSYIYLQGGESFAGGNKAYYGFIQDQLQAWVTLSHLLPAKKVIWTALETKGEDSEGIPVYGPAIAGRKSIAKAPQWFRNCLHIDVVSKPAKEAEVGAAKLMIAESERIMWLRNHADPVTRHIYPAKVRVPHSSMAPPYICPPDIGEVYRLIDRLEKEQAANSRGMAMEIEAVRERLLKAAAVAKERAEKAAVDKAKRAGTMPLYSMPGRTPAGPVPMPTTPTSAPAKKQGEAAESIATAPGIAAPAPSPSPSVAPPGSVPQIQTIRKKPVTPAGGLR